MKKLIVYTASLIVFFVSLEVFVRANHDYFYALSDKLLLKMEILKNRPNNDLVVFGSSRTLDGFDSPAFQKVLNTKHDLTLKVFNAGSTGQNLNRYLYSLERFLENEDIKVIVIESSEVGMREGSLRINLSKESSQPERSEGEESEASVEGSLQNFMVNNLYTVKVRKSFKPKAFFRLAMIWTSDRFNHDTWFRSGTLRQLTTGFFKEYSEEEVNKYKPTVIDETTEASGATINSSFEKIIALLKNTDKQIIFYNPPVSKVKSSDDCTEQRHGLYSEVAKQLQTQFLDYSCGGFPKEFLRDSTHLNGDGRVYFSQILANDLAPLLRAREL